MQTTYMRHVFKSAWSFTSGTFRSTAGAGWAGAPRAAPAVLSVARRAGELRESRGVSTTSPRTPRGERADGEVGEFIPLLKMRGI